MRRFIGLGLVLIVLVLLPSTLVASAYQSGTYGSGDYGICSYGVACSISLTSNGTVSLNVTPGAGGKCTIQSDTASVLTDDSNGYTLTLADNSTNTALLSGGNSIAATSGTFASPTALTANTWGYRVDGVGSFGSGPTTSQSNAIPGSLTFAGIEASNQTPDVLADTAVAADPTVTTTVWYGACADQTVTSGTYTTQVTYTALAN